MKSQLFKVYAFLGTVCLLFAAGANAAKPAKIDICHAPPDNPANTQLIQVGSKGGAAGDHLSHGDWAATEAMCDAISDNDCDGIPDDTADDDADCEAQLGDGAVCDAGNCVIPHPEWVFGNYNGTPTIFDPNVFYNGSVNCGVTCADSGQIAVGARFVCNHWDGGSSEGCDSSNHGEYGTANCGWMMRDGVELTENGNTEDCTYTSAGSISACVTGTCSEPVTWHAIECQCN